MRPSPTDRWRRRLLAVTPRSPFAALAAVALGLAAVASLGACTPHIGDSCLLSTDCATDGTRICDTSEPGGFCTVLGCTGTALGSYCPDNAICVLFNDNVPGCPASAYSPSRFSAAECRNSCSSNSDCRGGYVCRLPSGAPWDAVILDSNQSAKVCLPSLWFVDGGVQSGTYGYSGSPDALPPVCQAVGPSFDAGFSPLDAGFDAVGEAATDANAEAATDGAADASADAAPDASADAALDGGTDATLDGGTDATLDGGPDATLDAGADASDAAAG